MKRNILALVVVGFAAGVGLLIFLTSHPSQPLDNEPLGAPLSAVSSAPEREVFSGDAAQPALMNSGGAVSGANEADVVSEPLSRLPLSRIPGGSLVEGRINITDHPVGAEGLGNIFTSEKIEDDKRAERLARIALNNVEEPEVRQEALDQWLKFLPEECEPLLTALAKDERLSPAMAAILVKDALTRGELIQAEVAYALVGHKNPELRALAAEQLAQLTGKNHGDDAAAWSREIQIFMAARNVSP